MNEKIHIAILIYGIFIGSIFFLIKPTGMLIIYNSIEMHTSLPILLHSEYCFDRVQQGAHALNTMCMKDNHFDSQKLECKYT